MVSNRQRAIVARIKAERRRETLLGERKRQADRETAAYRAGYSNGKATASMQFDLPSDFVESVVAGFRNHLAREAMAHAARQGFDANFCYTVRTVAEEVLQSFLPCHIRREEIMSFVKWRAEQHDVLELGVELPAMRVRMTQDALGLKYLWKSSAAS